jgi:8-oxo-dGTP diphosphatase
MTGSWDDRAAFCPLCGADLAEATLYGAPRKTCTRCEYIQFRSPAGAAAVVIARGREILFVQRAIEPYRGAWGFPAGYQEYWEALQETAVREAREETGLQIRIERLLDLRYTTDDPRKRANVAVYLARAVGGTLRAADDARDARYFSLDALPEPIAFQNNRDMLQRLLHDYPHGDIL